MYTDTALPAIPKMLQRVVATIIAFSLIGGLTYRIALPFFETNLQSLLSLSSWGISNFYFWQFITYMFVQPLGNEMTIAFFIHLIFAAATLFYIGQALIQLRGTLHFFILFLGTGLFSALTTTGILALLGQPVYLAGCFPSIYALLVAWMFFYPNRELLLFLVFPVKVKHLVLAATLITLFIDLSNGHMINFLSVISAMLFGYFYAIIVFERFSPYLSLYKFEKKILELKHQLVGSRWDSIELYVEPKKRKVYDLKTGNIVLDDETFLNVCLEKMHKYGKHSLSIFEWFRMRRISKRMKKQNPPQNESP
jgi:membrane associated rhomboid family serine protease